MSYTLLENSLMRALIDASRKSLCAAANCMLARTARKPTELRSWKGRIFRVKLYAAF